MILTINTVIDGDDARHCSSGYESSGDGGATFLSSDSLLHQPDVALLLFVSATLGAKGGFQNVMQLDLVSDTILHVEHAEVMYFCRYAQVVQQEDGGIYLSSSGVVSDEKRVICVIDCGVGKVPSSSCV